MKSFLSHNVKTIFTKKNAITNDGKYRPINLPFLIKHGEQAKPGAP